MKYRESYKQRERRYAARAKLLRPDSKERKPKTPVRFNPYLP